jgi:hypothetical protein
MRFLKRQTINRRQLKSTTVYSDGADANVYINPRNSGSMVLPSGTDAQIPASPVNGMMRYNVDHNEVQVYQGSSWRSLRFKESTQITQQNLGAGDATTVYFGPLNPAPPTTVQSGTTWGGQNILVIVENVLQLNGTNYTIVQNPTPDTQTYTGKTSTNTTSGSTTINFDSTTGTVGTTIYPEAEIDGALVTGSSYLQSSTRVLSHTINTNTGALTSITINKPTITGTIASGTTLTIQETSNTQLSGYYLYFSSPVPYGKVVTALIGFDQ